MWRIADFCGKSVIRHTHAGNSIRRASQRAHPRGLGGTTGDEPMKFPDQFDGLKPGQKQVLTSQGPRVWRSEPLSSSASPISCCDFGCSQRRHGGSSSTKTVLRNGTGQLKAHPPRLLSLETLVHFTNPGKLDSTLTAPKLLNQLLIALANSLLHLRRLRIRAAQFLLLSRGRPEPVCGGRDAEQLSINSNAGV